MMDQNNILLDNYTSEWSSNYRKLDYERFFREYSILDEVDERARRRELVKNSDHTFVVKYEVKILGGQKDCFIKQILPESLGYPMRNEYNIVFHPHTKEIQNVQNRSFGNVKYKAIKLDETAGLALGGTVKLWTHLFRPQILNILHMHVNDTSDEVSLDVRYVMPEEADKIEQDNFNDETFDLDATGRPLRYKILIHNMKVWAVLYNTGSSIESIKFQEIRVVTGKEDYIKIEKSPVKFEFGQITNIPLAMLSTPNKQHIETLVQGMVNNELTVHCEGRNFEKLPGYVDVDILSGDNLNTVNGKPVKIAAAICKLEVAPPEYYQTY